MSNLQIGQKLQTKREIKWCCSTGGVSNFLRASRINSKHAAAPCAARRRRNNNTYRSICYEEGNNAFSLSKAQKPQVHQQQPPPATYSSSSCSSFKEKHWAEQLSKAEVCLERLFSIPHSLGERDIWSALLRWGHKISPERMAGWVAHCRAPFSSRALAHLIDGGIPTQTLNTHTRPRIRWWALKGWISVDTCPLAFHCV